MSGSDWPSDPNDPECPTCGEPVSATASYCLHCYADLPAAGFGPAEPTRGADTTARAVDTTRGTGDPGAADLRTADLRTADPGMPTDDPPVGQSGWLHPDSAVDDLSTATVGIVGGVVDGFLLFLLALWAVPRPVQSTWALGVGVVGWLCATVWIARTRTVFGAVRKAAYSLGLLMALAPPFAAYALRDPGALLVGIFVWPAAGVVAGVGWMAGRGALDDGG